MTALRLISIPLVASALLVTGCADNRFRADVTRFHLNQPVARGAVVVQPANPAQANTLEFQSYAAAVSNKLRQVGFTPVSNLVSAEFVAVVDYGQTTRQGLATRSPVSIGIGGGTFGHNVGIGLGTTFGLGKSRGSDTQVNMLALQLKRRSDNSVIWEGRAIAEASEDSPNAPLAQALPKLADALLSNFPGPSGQTVRYNEPRRG